MPALPGCVTQGTTREEALHRASEAISAHIKGLRADGPFIPEDIPVELDRHRCRSMTRLRVSPTPRSPRALERSGFVLIVTEGNHRHYRRPDGTGRVTIPVHAGEVLAPKTLRSILRQADLSVEDLQALL